MLQLFPRCLGCLREGLHHGLSTQEFVEVLLRLRREWQPNPNLDLTAFTRNTLSLPFHVIDVWSIVDHRVHSFTDILVSFVFRISVLGNALVNNKKVLANNILQLFNIPEEGEDTWEFSEQASRDMIREEDCVPETLVFQAVCLPFLGHSWDQRAFGGFCRNQQKWSAYQTTQKSLSTYIGNWTAQ